MSHRIAVMAVLWVVVGLSAGAWAQDAGELDALLKDLPKYKLGDSRRGLEQVTQIVVKVQKDAANRPMVAGKLAALLGQEGTYECKDFVCRQLYLIGTKAEVPAVAKLLPDERLSHMARYVLEAMAEPEADAAMREALANTKGKVQIGIINSLGMRRDVQAAPALIQILNGQDAPAAVAAASALGKIGGTDAQKALAAKRGIGSAELQAAVVDAYLLCADGLLRDGKKDQATAIYTEMAAPQQPARVRIAALRGLALAEPAKGAAMAIDLLKNEDEPALQALASGVARQIEGAEATAAFAAAMPNLKTNGQVMMLGVLGSRGGEAARNAVMAAVKSESVEVRLAALQAAGAVGDASSVPVLAGVAAKARGREQAAAREALARLRGQDVESAIVAAMKQDGAARAELIRATAARRASSAIEPLFALAKESDEATRIAAVEALGVLVEDRSFAELVGLFGGAKSDRERQVIRDALSAAGSRVAARDAASDAVYGAILKAPAEGKAALVAVLPRISGNRALDVTRAMLKDGDQAVQQAAARAIAEWPDASAIGDMLALAKGNNKTMKVLSLRGLVRVMSMPGGRSGAAAVPAYKEMMEAASAADEKRIVLAGLGEVKDAGALEIAAGQLGDAEAKADAAMAVVKIARNVMGSQPVETNAALQKVVDAKVNENVTKQAQEMLDKAK